MPNISFTAYSLEYFIEGKGYYDDNGDYHKQEGVWKKVGRCNAVPSGHDNVITLPDGHTETFSFMICVKNPRLREFKYGEKLRLTTVSGMEKKILTVRGFARYQLHCDIYA